MLKSLKARLALAAALTAVAGVAFVTTLHFYFSQRSTVEAVVAQNQSLVESEALDIDERLKLAIASLSQLASGTPSAVIKDADHAQRFLSRHLGLSALFQRVLIVDLKGMPVASVPALDRSMRSLSMAHRDWFVQSIHGNGKPYVSDPLVSRLTGRPVALISVPLYDKSGAPQGLMVATLDLIEQHLLGELTNARIGGSGFFVLLARDGTVVMHPNENLAAADLSALGLAAPSLKRALDSPRPGTLRGVDSEGVPSLFSFDHVHSADWTLVGVQPIHEALAPLARLNALMLWTGIGFALLLLPVMWWLVSRLLRPLDVLREQIRRVKEDGRAQPFGKLNYGASELRRVAIEFNEMAEARSAAQLALQHEKERAEVTLECIGDAVITTDREARINSMNSVAESITGWLRDEALGRPFGEIFAVSHEHDGTALEDVASLAMASNEIVNLPSDTSLRARDGHMVPVDDSAAPIRNSAGEVQGAVVVFRDVAAQRATVREINWRATHDAMTGLMNRAAFESMLDALVKELGVGATHGLLMIDLDQFKIVNDTGGHAAGDELLKQIAALFQQCTRKSDVVARLGGDEFGVLMYHCPADKALRMAEELRRAVMDWRFHWGSNVFRVGVSIGLAVVDAGAGSGAELEKAADMACYMAKRSGRNRICLHSADDQQFDSVRSEMQSVTRIQSAMEKNRLRLFAQRIHSIDEGRGEGLYIEVLLRMIDEAGELVAPNAFLPAAERYGLMDDLDRWVIASTLEACARHFAGRWDRLHLVCINLSAITLRDESVGPYLIEQLQKYQVPIERVCIEVTESAAMENIARVRQLTQGLREQGLRFALDDFGVGMASLARLRDLPVDVLKIDCSFIAGLSRDPINASIISTIQHLAHLMSLKTIAEGVERSEELIQLRALGVDYVQGYLSSVPAPIEEIFAAAEAAADSAAST